MHPGRLFGYLLALTRYTLGTVDQTQAGRAGRTTYCVFDLAPPALEVTCVRDSEHAPTGQKDNWYSLQPIQRWHAQTRPAWMLGRPSHHKPWGSRSIAITTRSHRKRPQQRLLRAEQQVRTPVWERPYRGTGNTAPHCTQVCMYSPKGLKGPGAWAILPTAAHSQFSTWHLGGGFSHACC